MENWIEITIHTTNEASEIVESILLDYGSTGVAIEDPTTLEENLHDDFGTIVELSPADFPDVGVVVKGYINELNFDDETFARFKGELEQLGKNINIGEFFKIETTTIKDSDWKILGKITLIFLILVKNSLLYLHGVNMKITKTNM